MNKGKKTETITIRVTQEEKDLIYKLAEKDRRKPGEFVYLLVIDALENKK